MLRIWRDQMSGSRRVTIALALFAALGWLPAAAAATVVRFRLVDSASGETTPAMVCITGHEDGSVRLPGRGQIATQPSRTEDFYNGIRFDPDRNWIGPVRK